MRITIVKRLINNYSSRARLRSVRRSRAKFTIARLFRASSSVFWRTVCTLCIANRDNGLSGYLSAVCARVAGVSSIVDIGNRLRAPEISCYKLFAPVFRHYQQWRCRSIREFSLSAVSSTWYATTKSKLHNVSWLFDLITMRVRIDGNVNITEK